MQQETFDQWQREKGYPLLCRYGNPYRMYKVNDTTLRFDFSSSCYVSTHFSDAQKPGQTITSVDPEGGPFLSVGNVLATANGYKFGCPETAWKILRFYYDDKKLYAEVKIVPPPRKTKDTLVYSKIRQNLLNA